MNFRSFAALGQGKLAGQSATTARVMCFTDADVTPHGKLFKGKVQSWDELAYFDIPL